MRRPSYRLCGGIGVFASALVLTATGFAAPAFAAQASQAGSVSPTPAAGTPQLATTSTAQQVRQLVECGGMIYAVGNFTTIEWGGNTYTRNSVFSFSATAPYTLSGLKVDVNGEVNTVAFTSHRGCADAYLGGKFTSVHATPAKNLAEVSTTTGAVVSGFGNNANGQVETLLGYHDHLLDGGYFTSINGSKADAYMASLSPSTGKNDGFLKLNISGNYQFPGVGSNPTRIYNQQLSHGGTLDLVEGDFTSVGGLPRQQIFMLNLSGSTAAVTGWTSPEFNAHCWHREPFYVQAAAWSANDSAVYIADTGFHPFNWVKGTFPMVGLCDAAAAFPATQQSVSHTWINYTGCDSLFSTAADASTVYIAGHERWADNPSGCNHPGPGSVHARGMAGLSPGTGAPLLNSAGTAGLYSRGRGLGADDMLLTSAGLWIASDNFANTNTCGGVSGHAGICFLPYP